MSTTEDAYSLLSYIESVGRYQWIQFTIICAWSVFSVEFMYNNFIRYTPEHWCKVETLSNMTYQDQKRLSIPWNDKTAMYSRCEMYDLNYTSVNNVDDVTKGHYHNVNVTSCREWMYDTSVFSQTVVTEWNLVCEREWLVDLVPTIQGVGILAGSLLAGIFSDRVGRYRAVVVFMIIKEVGSIMSLVSPNLPCLFISRVIIGMGGISSYIIHFVMILETVSPEHRTWMGVVKSATFSIGCMILAGFSYAVRDWRYVQLFSVIPSALILPLFIIFVYETPRWLLQQGQHDKAMCVIKRIAKINSKHLPHDFKRRVSESGEKMVSGSNQKVASSANFFDLFKTSTIRRYTITCSTTWFTASLIFFALSLNAKALSGDLFINFFLLSAVEAIANFMSVFFLRTRLLGRKWTNALSLILAGVACFICVPLLILFGKSYTVTTLAMFGKIGATIAFTGIFILTTELFPTEVRNLGVGTCSMTARIGALMAPYVGGFLGHIWMPLPSIIFGVTATISAVLVLLLPETLGKPLKDTIEEVENEKRDKQGKKDFDVNAYISTI